MHARGKDLAVNVCKEKKKTNVRSSTSDIAIKLTPAFKVSLEEAMSLINDDELLEVTPKNIRMRKKLLTQDQRVRAIHTASRKAQEEAE
jgi:GTP-binding protein